VATVADDKAHYKGVLTIKNVLKHSLKGKFEVHCSSIESLLSSLEGMIRQPSGCFEQVSASNYPNILALQLLNATKSANKTIRKKANAYLDRGYKKLAGYEVKGGGFESWLLNRKNGKGGWLASQGYSHGWQNAAATSNAYIVHALAYIGETAIEQELQAASKEAENSKDLYRLALVTLAHFHLQHTQEAKRYLALLRVEADKMGLENLRADQSITYSSGKSLKNELLGLLIVWALKALTAYQAFNKKGKQEKGTVQLFVNQKLALEEPMSTKQLSNIVTDGLSDFLVEGQNTIEIIFKDISSPPAYDLNLSWQTHTPETVMKSPVTITTQLSTSKTTVGENVTLAIELHNRSKQGCPTPIAMVGIPAGLSLQPWQLKELVKQGKADFIEVHHNYLVLYYRNFKAGERKKVNLVLKADIAGQFTAAASSSYPYYQNDLKYWRKGSKIRIEE